MTDLFTWRHGYPDRAGYKEATTSRDAAAAIDASGRGATLRRRIEAFLTMGGTGTADEIAAVLRESILAVRPRVSELRRLGVIEPTGERRISDGGRPAHVWKIRP